jgi:hypothetical protein
VGNLLKKNKSEPENQWKMKCPYCGIFSMAYPVAPNRLRVVFKGRQKDAKELETFINEYKGTHGPYTAWAICEKCKGFWVHRLTDIGGGPKLTGVWNSPEPGHSVCPNCKTVYATGVMEKYDIVSIECTCGGWKPRKRDICKS